MNADLDNGHELSKFFGVLKGFNRQIPFDIELKQRIEQFFDHRWQFDKNSVMESQEFATVVEQLSDDHETALYRDFLFKKFIKNYSKIFEMPKKAYEKTITIRGKDVTIKIQNARFTFYDTEYKQLIISLTKLLEPVFYNPNEIIINELDEFGEVIFPMKGKYKTGFTINRKQYFVQTLELNVIGAYGVTFN